MAFEQCNWVYSLMSGFNRPWFVAGGWALDLFIGRETRKHEDIEIAIFRDDQLQLKQYLNGWDFHQVVRAELKVWKDELLELPIHEIHASNKVTGKNIEILLNESTGNEWKFRRDLRIGLPLTSIWSLSETGIPFLNPEIILLYKAKNTREKDHQDYWVVKELLSAEKQDWLWDSLNMLYPQHEWLVPLNRK
jgi:hypothetical protein